MYLLLTYARLFLYNQSVFFRTFQLYTITVKTSFAIGETWRFLYDIDSVDVRCMVLLTGGLTFSEFTYKFWYPFAVINWCSHYDVLMSAFSSTTDHLLWSTHCWVMNNFGHVWASVKMPSKCHVPSPVWSVRRKKKMNQKYWLYINVPWEIWELSFRSSTGESSFFHWPLTT